MNGKYGLTELVRSIFLPPRFTFQFAGSHFAHTRYLIRTCTVIGCRILSTFAYFIFISDFDVYEWKPNAIIFVRHIQVDRLLKYAELDCGKVMCLYVAYMWFKCTVKCFPVLHDEHSLIDYPYQLSYIFCRFRVFIRHHHHNWQMKSSIDVLLRWASLEV